MAKARPRKTRRTIKKAARLRRARGRDGVTRREYNQIIEVLNQSGEILNDLRRELEVQFKRMAQMQSELDEVRRAWVKSGSGGEGRD